MSKLRKNSIAFGGGAFGDEGKGRVVDEYVNDFSKKYEVILYRDNGGANAGHTVEIEGMRIALHQLPSGVFVSGSSVVLGKGMVIHPGDLLEEIRMVKESSGGKINAHLIIDEMATLCLDTHRAMEGAQKAWNDGSKATTGRGISPAYCDILYRQPIRMRDLKRWDEEKIRSHYKLYNAIINGMGVDMSSMEVNSLAGEKVLVGSEDEFVVRLKSQTEQFSQYIQGVFEFLSDRWVQEDKYAFVFEKAQGFGLDARFGVYPDITASDTTFHGITSSTELVVDAQNIEKRVAVIKATYMSSVGSRKLPTLITDSLAERIREDAHEYGATTKRPRDIAYIDIPALKFFKQASLTTHYALTHMDIVYMDTPIKVCVGYEMNGKKVSYRPDQEYLLNVTPIYEELKPWSVKDIQGAKKYNDIPKEAKDYLDFISNQLEAEILVITTGPKREQTIVI